MFTEQLFVSGEVRLNYAQSAANGPPLLLLHGVTRCWKSFLTVAPSLATRWQIHAIDFRGHGTSSPRPEQYRVVHYLEDALTFLQQQIGKPAVVYGHSLGAMVAAALGAAAPELVRGLILEDPPFDTMGSRITENNLHSYFSGIQPLAGSREPVATVAEKLAEIRLSSPGSDQSIRVGDTRDPSSVRFSASCLTRLAPEVLSPIVAGQWLQGYDRDHILKNIDCPTLLLQADVQTGGMLTDADAASVKEKLADCTHVKIPEVGHMIHWLQPDTTLRLATGFLETFDR